MSHFLCKLLRKLSLAMWDSFRGKCHLVALRIGLALRPLGGYCGDSHTQQTQDSGTGHEIKMDLFYILNTHFWSNWECLIGACVKSLFKI